MTPSLQTNFLARHWTPELQRTWDACVEVYGIPGRLVVTEPAEVREIARKELGPNPQPQDLLKWFQAPFSFPATNGSRRITTSQSGKTQEFVLAKHRLWVKQESPRLNTSRPEGTLRSVGLLPVALTLTALEWLTTQAMFLALRTACRLNQARGALVARIESVSPPVGSGESPAGGFSLSELLLGAGESPTPDRITQAMNPNTLADVALYNTQIKT